MSAAVPSDGATPPSTGTGDNDAVISHFCRSLASLSSPDAAGASAWILQIENNPSAVLVTDLYEFRSRYRSQFTQYRGRDWCLAPHSHIEPPAPHYEKFAVLFFYDRDREAFHGLAHFTAQCEGAPGLVHGGAIATVFDELHPAIIHHRHQVVPLTLRLSVEYQRAIRVNSVVQFRVRLTREHGRRMDTESELLSLRDRTGSVCVAYHDSVNDSRCAVHCVSAASWQESSKLANPIHAIEALRHRSQL